MKTDRQEMNLAERTEDEEVDGPAVAAGILTRLNESQRQRLLCSIRARNSAAADRIEGKLFSFEDIAKLTAPGIQLLIKNVDNHDLIKSLKHASGQVRDALLSNMSARRRQIVEEDLSALGIVSTKDLQDAQQRILIKLDELRKSGAVRSKDDRDVWV